MSVTTTIYRKYKTKVLDNSTKIALATDTIKVALCDSSYAPSTSHSFFSDITHEITSAGYTGGGAVISGVTINEGANTTITATDVTWSASSITARYAIIYKSTGTPNSSPLIAYVDFGADKSSDGDNFIISWDASNGIFYVT